MALKSRWENPKITNLFRRVSSQTVTRPDMQSVRWPADWELLLKLKCEFGICSCVLKSCLSIFEFVVNLDFCNDCLEEFFSFYPFYVSSSWKSGWRYQYKRFFCIFEYQRKYLKYLMHVLGLATMTNSVVMNVPYCIWQHSLAFQSRWSAENILWRVEVGL